MAVRVSLNVEAGIDRAVLQAQKKRAEDMIVEEDKIDGMELIEAKVFK